MSERIKDPALSRDVVFVLDVNNQQIFFTVHVCSRTERNLPLKSSSPQSPLQRTGDTPLSLPYNRDKVTYPLRVRYKWRSKDGKSSVGKLSKGSKEHTFVLF
jgi:hypothetical protein